SGANGLAHNVRRAHSVGGPSLSTRSAACPHDDGPAGRTPRVSVWRLPTTAGLLRCSPADEWRVAAALEPAPPGVGDVRLGPAGANLLTRARGLSPLPLDGRPFDGDSRLGLRRRGVREPVSGRPQRSSDRASAAGSEAERR